MAALVAITLVHESTCGARVTCTVPIQIQLPHAAAYQPACLFAATHSMTCSTCFLRSSYANFVIVAETWASQSIISTVGHSIVAVEYAVRVCEVYLSGI